MLTMEDKMARQEEGRQIRAVKEAKGVKKVGAPWVAAAAAVAGTVADARAARCSPSRSRP